eukprot:760566-Pleurochrysis_carterae.AAC.2
MHSTQRHCSCRARGGFARAPHAASQPFRRNLSRGRTDVHAAFDCIFYMKHGWLVYGCIVTVAATVQTAAFAALDMFPHSSYLLLAMTLELHGLAAVALSFVVVAAVRVKGACRPSF